MGNSIQRKKSVTETLGAIRRGEEFLLDESLKFFDLTFAGVTGEGFSLLAKALTPGVELLDVRGNMIQDGGFIVAANLLKNNTSLRTLLLDGNRASVIGASALASALTFNTGLTSLSLSNNGIEYDGMILILRSLRCNSTLKSLNLAGTISNHTSPPVCVEELINVFSGLSLATLNLGGNHLESSTAYALGNHLGISSTLSNLNIIGNDFHDDSIAVIADNLRKNSTLKYLNLSYNLFSSDGMNALASCLYVNTTLEELDITNPQADFHHFDIDALLTACNQNNYLTTLRFSVPKFQESTVRTISDFISTNTTLTSLSISGPPLDYLTMQEFLSAISRNHTLVKLDLPKDIVPYARLAQTPIYEYYLIRNQATRLASTWPRTHKTLRDSHQQVALTIVMCFHACAREHGFDGVNDIIVEIVRRVLTKNLSVIPDNYL